MTLLPGRLDWRSEAFPCLLKLPAPPFLPPQPLNPVRPLAATNLTNHGWYNAKQDQDQYYQDFELDSQ